MIACFKGLHFLKLQFFAQGNTFKDVFSKAAFLGFIFHLWSVSIFSPLCQNNCEGYLPKKSVFNADVCWLFMFGWQKKKLICSFILEFVSMLLPYSDMCYVLFLFHSFIVSAGSEL